MFRAPLIDTKMQFFVFFLCFHKMRFYVTKAECKGEVTRRLELPRGITSHKTYGTSPPHSAHFTLGGKEMQFAGWLLCF